MSEIQVLVADASGEFSRKMADAVALSDDMTLAAVVGDGDLVVDSVARLHPDVLILELMLPNTDGISIIRDLNTAKAQGWLTALPLIIVVSAIISESNTYLLRDAGVDYFMVKPVAPAAVLERARDLLGAAPKHTAWDASGVSTVASGDADIDRSLTSLLIDIGIPASLSGYTYLREAIHMVIDTGITPDGALSKLIYPVIARKYAKTPASVEKAIRTAIETAWMRGHTELLNRLFGYTVNAQRGKPTNTEFIAMIADRYSVYGQVQ